MPPTPPDTARDHHHQAEQFHRTRHPTRSRAKANARRGNTRPKPDQTVRHKPKTRTTTGTTRPRRVPETEHTRHTHTTDETQSHRCPGTSRAAGARGQGCEHAGKTTTATSSERAGPATKCENLGHNTENISKRTQRNRHIQNR